MSFLTHGRPSLSILGARLHPSCFVFQSLTHTEKNHKLEEKSLQRAGLWRKWFCSIRHDLEHIQFSTFYLACAYKKKIVFYSHHFINILFYKFVGYTLSLPIRRLYLLVPIRRKYFSIHNTSSILSSSTNILYLTFLTQTLTNFLIKNIIIFILVIIWFIT
jgi:hypothetical protein